MASVSQSTTASQVRRANDKKTRRDPPTIEALLSRPGDFIAATYIRESRFLNAVDGFGMGAQYTDTRQFCVKMGWPNPEDLNFADGVDENASGADWDLKDLNRMLDAAEEGRFHVLVVPRNDRFARNITKALVLEKQLNDRGVRVVFLNLPLNSQGTPEGDMLKNTLHSFAEYDRAKIALNTARGRRAKAAMGLYVGTGPIPYGYTRVLGSLPGVTSALRVRTMGLKIDEATAPVVRRIFEWAAYLPCADITDRLTRAGDTPPGRAPRWLRSTVRQIIGNPVYYGLAMYGRPREMTHAQRSIPTSGISVSVPPIVSEALWQRANDAIVDRKCKRGPNASSDLDRFDLRGLLRCSNCGRVLRSWTSPSYVGKTPRAKTPPPIYYHCAGANPTAARDSGQEAVCPLRLIPAKALHTLVWEMVETTLRDPDRVTVGLERERDVYDSKNARRSERITIIEKELAPLRRNLRRTIDDKIDKERGSAAWLMYDEKERGYEKLIAKHERELAGLRALPTEGLSASAADAFREALREVSAGLDDLRDGPAMERLDFYRQIGLSGEIRLDAAGDDPGAIAVGRHRYVLEFRARIDLVAPSTTNSDNNFVNFTDVGNQIQRNPFRVENGYIPVPTAPGLGVDIDEAALENFAYREFPARTIRGPGDEGP